MILIDLYKGKFNPVLIFNEGKKRRDLLYEKETEKYRTLIKEVDTLREKWLLQIEEEVRKL